MWAQRSNIPRRRNVLLHALGDRRGSAAVEFAIVGPIFVVLLLGIMSYGGYFWLAHSVQQLANDSARAAVAGLDVNERQQLVQSTIDDEMPGYTFFSASTVNTAVTSQPNTMTVSIAFNASNTPFWALSSLVPMPPTTITRSATIKLAGY